MPDTDVGEILKKQRGRAAKLSGKRAEDIVRMRLIGLGLLRVQRVATPVEVRRFKGKIIGATFRGRVDGDFHAVVPGTGRAVLVEVKKRPEPLIWSVLEPHQVQALNSYRAVGALPLLAWVCPGKGVAVMSWPNPLFAPRSSLQWADAELFNLATISKETP